MDKFKNTLDRIIGAVSVVIMIVMVLLTLWQVFARYVLNNPSGFSEVLTRFLFVWLVVITATYVFGQKDHMAITYVKDKFSEKNQKILNIAIECITIIFASTVMIYGGSIITKMQMSQTDATLLIPTGYIYSIIPICGVVIVIYCILNILEYINIKKKECVKEGNR